MNTFFTSSQNIVDPAIFIIKVFALFFYILGVITIGKLSFTIIKIEPKKGCSNNEVELRFMIKGLD